MENILITGGAGFIGSHLSEYLLANNRVTCIDNLSTGRLSNISHLIKDPNYVFIRENIMNEVVMDRLISQSDVVIHLAAAVGVQLITENPIDTILTNIRGSEIVLDIASKYYKKVLITSTSEVYGKNTKIPFEESDDTTLGATVNSRWGYAISKAVDEVLALGYYKKFNLPVVITRLFNTVGERQTGQYGMVLPRFIHSALNEKPLQVYGDGSQTRCFTNVRDVVSTITKLIYTDKAVGEIFNIGSVEEISIFELAKKVIAKTKSNSQIEFIPYKEAYGDGFEDMPRRVPSLKKIENLIGYKPKYTLDDTIELIVKGEKLL